MNKSTILNATSPTELFLHYLGLDSWPSSNISSPFSDDRTPSFKLYKNGTFKCHSTGRQGDIWQFVADLNDLDCKADFDKVLAIISRDFGIKDETSHFSYSTKAFEKFHLDWWNQGNWNVSKDHLQNYRVFALDKFEYYSAKNNQIERRKIFPGVVAFAYELNSRVELYLPAQAKNKKFVMNKTRAEDMFGLEQLPDQSRIIVIAAGKKDSLILNANGIPSISFRSENHFPSIEQIELLKSKCEQLCILYDNDEPGQNAMMKIASKYKLVEIRIPSEFNDIADYLKVHYASSITKYIDEAISVFEVENQEDKGSTIFDVTEDWLSKRYEFRYNTISLDIEYRKKGYSSWSVVNENTLYIQLQKSGIKCSINNLIAILKSEFVPEFNPLSHYFTSLPTWNGSDDHIAQLSSFVHAIDQGQFNYHFKKWLVRVVRCALEPDYFNKQAFVFVQRGQNTGKSTFCRFLCPPTLRNYIAEDISQDKDARIMLCKNLFINLDELAGLNKKEIESLKSIFSKTKIKERLPYDRKASTLARTCSFVGSTNEDAFLNDPTGSVRWLCFRIKSIDWAYSTQINIDQVWSQAFYLATHKFECELTLADIKNNETRNKSFQILSAEMELLSKYVKPSDNKYGKFMTAADIMVKFQELYPRINKIQIGKAMSALGHQKIKNSQLQVYGYYVELRSFYEDPSLDPIPEFTPEDYRIKSKTEKIK